MGVAQLAGVAAAVAPVRAAGARLGAQGADLVAGLLRKSFLPEGLEHDDKLGGQGSGRGRRLPLEVKLLLVRRHARARGGRRLRRRGRLAVRKHPYSRWDGLRNGIFVFRPTISTGGRAGGAETREIVLLYGCTASGLHSLWF
jgi:hypothetical protein